MNNSKKDPIKRIKWTKEEIEILRKYYSVYTAKKLKEKFNLNHTCAAIRKEAELLGLAHKRNIASWSDKEIADLCNLVEKHPQNLRDAFRIHAINYNRNWTAVERYFSNLRRRGNIKTCMLIIGKTRYVANRKNIFTGMNVKPNTQKPSKWRRIISILFE